MLFCWILCLIMARTQSGRIFWQQILRHRHARWPVDVVVLLHQCCCWALSRMSCHWAWLCRGYWPYRNLIDWLIFDSLCGPQKQTPTFNAYLKIHTKDKQPHFLLVCTLFSHLTSFTFSPSSQTIVFNNICLRPQLQIWHKPDNICLKHKQNYPLQPWPWSQWYFWLLLVKSHKQIAFLNTKCSFPYTTSGYSPTSYKIFNNIVPNSLDLSSPPENLSYTHTHGPTAHFSKTYFSPASPLVTLSSPAISVSSRLLFFL